MTRGARGPGAPRGRRSTGAPRGPPGRCAVCGRAIRSRPGEARRTVTCRPECARVRRNQNARRLRAADPEKSKRYSREYARKWHAANREKSREIARRWYQRHPERARELARRWREENPERFREIARKSRLKLLEEARRRGGAPAPRRRGPRRPGRRRIRAGA